MHVIRKLTLLQCLRGTDAATMLCLPISQLKDKGAPVLCITGLGSSNMPQCTYFVQRNARVLMVAGVLG